MINYLPSLLHIRPGGTGVPKIICTLAGTNLTPVIHSTSKSGILI